MKPDNTLTKKSKRTVPHIYALLFAIIVVCTILTWILPAGQFDRVDDVVVAGTFHAVESTPVGLFQMFQLIHTGFCDAGGVIFFVFIAYASIGMIISSGAFNGLVAALLRLFKGKARVVIIPVFLTIVGIASSTIGLFSRSGSPSFPSSPESLWPWALTPLSVWPSWQWAPAWAIPAP